MLDSKTSIINLEIIKKAEHKYYSEQMFELASHETRNKVLMRCL